MSAKAIAVLQEVLPIVQDMVECDGYGFFIGGDPRKFTPDPECSTEQEQAKWKADCEAWDRGEQVDTSGNVGRWVSEHMHIRPGGYGLGTYTFEDPQVVALVQRIKEAILELGGTVPEEPTTADGKGA